jgi:hypothetical protein
MAGKSTLAFHSNRSFLKELWAISATPDQTVRSGAELFFYGLHKTKRITGMII